MQHWVNSWRISATTSNNSQTLRAVTNLAQLLPSPRNPLDWLGVHCSSRNAGSPLSRMICSFPARHISPAWMECSSLRCWPRRSSIGQLVELALRMAVVKRHPPAGLLHHSDRGSEFTSDRYLALLAELGIQVSMSRTANWYDNAAMESFFATLTKE